MINDSKVNDSVKTALNSKHIKYSKYPVALCLWRSSGEFKMIFAIFFAIVINALSAEATEPYYHLAPKIRVLFYWVFSMLIGFTKLFCHVLNCFFLLLSHRSVGAFSTVHILKCCKNTRRITSQLFFSFLDRIFPFLFRTFFLL